ncbi:MAG: hypothetical protein RIB46_17060 [Pseudomonadales bacterium]
MLKKLWNDPVGSKMIATAAVALLAFVASYLAGWWPTIWDAIKSFFLWFGETTPTYNWILVIAGCLILLVCVLAVAAFRSDRRTITHTLYTQDSFDGLTWRWKIGAEGFVWDLYAFCPRCDYQVFAHNASSYRALDVIQYSCDSCGYRTGEFEETVEHLESRVMRFSQQKLRNGSWLDVVKSRYPDVAS